MRIAIIGTGTMGRALGLGLLRAGEAQAEELLGTARHGDRAARAAELLGFSVHTRNAEAVRAADVVLLCTKPHVVEGVLAELAQVGALQHRPLLISIAAGVGTQRLEEAALPADSQGASPEAGARVVWAMPNTPCLVASGMTVLTAGKHVQAGDLDLAERLFRPLGRVLRLDEEHMNAVTGLSRFRAGVRLRHHRSSLRGRSDDGVAA